MRMTDRFENNAYIDRSAVTYSDRHGRIFGPAADKLAEYEDTEEENKTEAPMRIIALTEEEIDCFVSYIDDCKGTEMDINFGNSDWCDIYKKIVGDRASDYAKQYL